MFPSSDLPDLAARMHRPRRGAVGKALIAYLLTGSVGLAVVVFLLAKGCGG